MCDNVCVVGLLCCNVQYVCYCLSACNDTQFRCSISQSQCVPLCKVCDGVLDCSDWTDEANCCTSLSIFLVNTDDLGRGDGVVVSLLVSREILSDISDTFTRITNSYH